MFRLKSFLRNLVQRDRVDRDLDDELQQTYDLLVHDKVRSGLSADAARREARLEFGNIETLKDDVRDGRAGAGIDILLQDLRFALRVFRQAPWFTAAAVGTVALGVGANAAVFAVVKSVLLADLPYADAERLVTVRADGAAPSLSAGVIADIDERQKSLDRLAAFQGSTSDAVSGVERPRIARVAWVEPHFFETLGVAAARGRTFQRDEAVNGLAPLSAGQLVPDTARVVVLSDAGWQRLFAGEPNVVGRDVHINRTPRTVIGVLPRGFIGPMGDADFYFPFDLRPVAAHPAAGRGASWLGLIGRVKEDATVEQAHHEIGIIGTDLAREHPQSKGVRLSAVPLHEAMVGDARTPLLLVMGSAALVLLIACANLAGAVLSRILSRRRELAVRVALGAGSRRLARQILTENATLTIAGGVGGLMIAGLLLTAFRRLVLPVLPAYADPSVDAGVLLAAGAAALCTGLLSGLVPAIAASRSDPQVVLREEARGSTESGRSRRMRGVLVAAQVGLCISLLAGAGLLARSLIAMSTAPLGFDPDGVLTVALQLPPRDYRTAEDRARFLDQFVSGLRTIPSVSAVASATWLPTEIPVRSTVTIQGAAEDGAVPRVVSASVSDDYFRALRIRLRSGRTFDTYDGVGAPARAVISQSMADRFWPGRDAIGQRIRIGANPTAPFMEVIGIVDDVINDRTRLDAEPMIYTSNRRLETQAPFASFLLRTQGDPLSLVRNVERELAVLDPGLPVDRVRTLNDVVGQGLQPRRLPVMLLTAFGGLALLLVSIGVYALFANMVTAREGEFAVRLTLGARKRAIAGLILKQGIGWMGAGFAAGAVGSIQVSQLLRDRLYGISPFDAIALALAVGILTMCATIASLIPLRRATRVNLGTALRAM